MKTNIGHAKNDIETAQNGSVAIYVSTNLLSSSPRFCFYPLHLSIIDDATMAESRKRGDRRAEAAESSPAKFPKSDVFKFEHYAPVRPLGQGAFGSVRLFKHVKNPNLEVAIKRIILNNVSAHSKSIIQQESSIQMYALGNRILEILNRRYFENTYEMMLEYADGGCLASASSSLAPNTLKRYFKQLMEGVQWLHNKYIVHLDLKPQNILIKSNCIKIADFGAADVCEGPNGEEKVSKAQGTEMYMAPERNGLPYLGSAADIWSCGIILVELMAGQPPWTSTNTSDFDDFNNKNVINEFWGRISMPELVLINEMLKIEPTDRINAADVLNHGNYGALIENVIDQRFAKRPMLKQRRRSAPNQVTGFSDAPLPPCRFAKSDPCADDDSSEDGKEIITTEFLINIGDPTQAMNAIMEAAELFNCQCKKRVQRTLDIEHPDSRLQFVVHTTTDLQKTRIICNRKEGTYRDYLQLFLCFKEKMLNVMA
uniref:Protein kinase domain-containing protein n=2 Tax=Panagrellus redivivus TaxID=6233 RepID=A0A7E4VYL9_PANRE